MLINSDKVNIKVYCFFQILALSQDRDKISAARSMILRRLPHASAVYKRKS